MKERIEILLVEVSPAETRIAVVDEKNTLVEFHIDRINQKSLVGGVYQGRVVRVETVSYTHLTLPTNREV